MGAFDVAHIANEDYLEFMYKRYQEDRASVDGEWQAYFGSMDITPSAASSTGTQVEDASRTQTDRGVMALVHAFRSLGHMVANLDPLGYKRPPNPLLEISEYGFSEADLDKVVGDGGFLGSVDGTLRDLLDKLKATYCRSLGVEYVEIPYKSQREWLQRQMEPHLNQPQWTPSQSKHILDQLIAAETFEQFLHTKYIGHKRFSIEGGESLIPLLTTLIESGAALDVGEIVMGMAHRGRLNVLAHMMNKPYDMILSEFEGVELDISEGSGDVKYHMGFSHDYTTLEGKQVHLSLSPNPSHLELVNPVIEGIVFAKQTHIGDIQCQHVVPVVIHGDAAFTGQGIVPETICLSHLEEYDTGGTVHIIVNNQIGFTAEPRETRFTSYPSDVAKVVQVPVFHVNADDPEAVVHAARLAMTYRQAVKADVIIDLWCYRRYGHNEADDPMYTQPLRSQEIAKQPTVATKYAQYLVEHNQITQEEVDQLRAARREKLDAALESGKQHRVQEVMPAFGGVWKGLG
ncbi:MAG: thiamine pyrophosphate-dependent enzyme, partial [bacterium]|nr:thiamine pyrophosphate-dependent enzyme [bacterium]